MLSKVDFPFKDAEWKQTLSVVLKPGPHHEQAVKCCSLPALSKPFAPNCSAQTTHNLVDNTESVQPVIVMQMLMDSEVL